MTGHGFVITEFLRNVPTPIFQFLEVVRCEECTVCFRCGSFAGAWLQRRSAGLNMTTNMAAEFEVEIHILWPTRTSPERFHLMN